MEALHDDLLMVEKNLTVTLDQIKEESINIMNATQKEVVRSLEEGKYHEHEKTKSTVDYIKQIFNKAVEEIEEITASSKDVGHTMLADLKNDLVKLRGKSEDGNEKESGG